MIAAPPGPGDRAQLVITRLAALGRTLAVAESLTGGRLAAALTAVPGASSVFRAGVVAYATELKHVLLGVEATTLSEHGAVSERTAQEMAAGVARVAGADWAMATTGVAGPDPQEGHPVGTVFVAVAGPATDPVVRRLTLSGGRTEIQDQTVAAALDLLLARLGDGSTDDRTPPVARSAGVGMPAAVRTLGDSSPLS